MPKKPIHHFNRGVVIGLEVVGFAIVLLFLGWLGLIFRLSQGPMNADFLTDRMERALAEQQGGFMFDVRSTQLTWGSKFDPLELELDDVQISRSDKTPVMAVRKIGVQFSKRYLVFGRFIPKAIKIYGPAVNLIRWEDGHFTLNLNEREDAGEETAADIESQKELISGYLLRLQDDDAHLLLGGLRQISVSDASVLYQDKALGASWKARNADVVFARGKGGIISNTILDLDMDENRKAIVRVGAYYSWQTQKTSAVIAFSGLVPSLAAQQSEQLKALSDIKFPIKGAFSLELDSGFRPGPSRFELAAELGAASLEAKGTLDPQKSGGALLGIQGSLAGMPISALKDYWPEALAPDPRHWVITNLSEGRATRATIDMALLLDAAAEKKVTLQKLGGEIDFEGITVDYFSPLKKALNAGGKASYDAKSFNIDVTSGTLGDMALQSSKIRMTELDVADHDTHAKADISVTLKGPLKTALSVLDSKPLEYPSNMGLRTADVAGDAAVTVNFKFPLHKALQIHEVEVKADAKLNDVMLGNVVRGMALSGGPMDVSLEKSVLTVKGKGRLDAMPLDFTWTRNFAENAEVQSRAEAQLPLDAAAMKAFGAPESLAVSGVMPVEASYTEQRDKTATLILKGDIERTAFSVAEADFDKVAGVPGTLGMTVLLKDEKPYKITGFNLRSGETAVEGEMDVGADGVQKASLDKILLGDTDIVLDMSRGADGGYVMKVTGRQMDISRLLKQSDAPNSDEEAAKKIKPFTLTLAVNRVITARDRDDKEKSGIDDVKMFLRRNEWQRIEQFEMNGISGNKPLFIRYMPAEGGHSLKVEAQNAGAALSALGISKSIRGGNLIVDAAADPKSGPRDMKGDVILTDFTLVDTPVLAQLLNAVSLIGIVELLNGKGIAFKKARAKFSWVDRGAPLDTDNTRMIKIKDGKTSGASLGLTFEGNIDQWKNTLDLEGTLIPVSDLNKLLGIIPLVGDILTGGGEGVFAATYKVKGPKKAPTVTVNPLAALAPGILRQIFFEN